MELLGAHSVKGPLMPRKIGTLAATTALIGALALTPAGAAEREQVRAVINLIAAVKMPFPEKLRNNLSRTEVVVLDTNASTTACLRLDDKMKWCYEHIAAVGARAEMLRIRAEPIAGIVPGQAFQYAVDFDLDGQADLGSTTKIEGEPHAPDRPGDAVLPSRHRPWRPVPRRLPEAVRRRHPDRPQASGRVVLATTISERPARGRSGAPPA